ncbi:hypothetical protein ACFL21_00795 [Patescibacteria group bacterium]
MPKPNNNPEQYPEDFDCSKHSGQFESLHRRHISELPEETLEKIRFDLKIRFQSVNEGDGVEIVPKSFLLELTESGSNQDQDCSVSDDIM